MENGHSLSACGVCGKSRSVFVMNNKTVCLKCDELLFDIEIECDESDRLSTKEKAVSPAQLMRMPIATALKK